MNAPHPTPPKRGEGTRQSMSRGNPAMRIVVHGQEAFGKAVLERLLERKENVVAVFCAPDKAGRAEDPLKVFAKERGLPVHQPKSWRTPARGSSPTCGRGSGTRG